MQDSLPIRREMLRAFMRTPLARCGRWWSDCCGWGGGFVDRKALTQERAAAIRAG